jgi:hypothetical protein
MTDMTDIKVLLARIEEKQDALKESFVEMRDSLHERVSNVEQDITWHKRAQWIHSMVILGLGTAAKLLWGHK